jgi:hypothetical protein
MSSETQHVDSDLALTFRTSAATVGEDTVDAWELKAARRALMNLRTLLHGQPMLDLLKGQIEEANRYYSSIVAASEGQYRECRVDIVAEGLTATEFVGWFAESMAMDADIAAIERTYPAHPEHYLQPVDPGIVEVIGGRPANLRMEFVADHADLPAGISQLAHPDYPFKLTMAVSLQDGTNFAYVLHELRDTSAGCDIILRVMWPAASPDDFFDEHSEHFSIEFRNWLHAAASARAATSSSFSNATAHGGTH